MSSSQPTTCTCPTAFFAPDNPAALDAAVSGVALVLNCAGPFMHAAQPMLEACMRVCGRPLFWGRAEAADGCAVESRLTTPEPYNLTVLAALWVADQVLAGHAPTGYQTPSSAYGPDWISGVAGCGEGGCSITG